MFYLQYFVYDKTSMSYKRKTEEVDTIEAAQGRYISLLENTHLWAFKRGITCLNDEHKEVLLSSPLIP